MASSSRSSLSIAADIVLEGGVEGQVPADYCNGGAHGAWRDLLRGSGGDGAGGRFASVGGGGCTCEIRLAGVPMQGGRMRRSARVLRGSLFAGRGTADAQAKARESESTYMLDTTSVGVLAKVRWQLPTRRGDKDQHEASAREGVLGGRSNKYAACCSKACVLHRGWIGTRMPLSSK